MEKDSQNLFRHLKPATPPADLLDKILFRISNEQHMAMSVRLKARLFISSVVAITMIICFIPAWNWFHGDITQTGFSQFLSLLFSDLGSVLNYWQDFSLSLLESIPFFSFLGILAVTFLFLFAIQYALRDIKTFFSSRHLPLLKI
jgi:hypothetical protein